MAEPMTDDPSKLNILLFNAAKKGSVTEVQSLIQQGADVGYSINGNPVLLLAVQKGYVDVTQALLSARADINQTNNHGWTALHVATFYSHPKIVQILLQSGCDTTCKNSDGKTALDIAKKNNKEEIINMIKSSQDVFATPISSSSSTTTSSFFQSYKPKLESDLLNELAKNYNELMLYQSTNQIKLSEILEEKNIEIEKIGQKILNSYEFKVIESKEKFVTLKKSEMNYQNHLHEIRLVQQKLKMLQEEMVPLQADVVNATKALETSKIEIENANKAILESQILMEKINLIRSSNNQFISEWKKKVAERKVQQWNSEDIKALLSSIKMEKWFNALAQHGFNGPRLFTINPNDFLSISFQGSKMKIGEAKFLYLTIKEIQDKGRIPIICSDIDLNTNNIVKWTIENVENYFNSQKCYETAKVLKFCEINGLVLVNLTNDEIMCLPIENNDEKNKLIEFVFSFSPYVSSNTLNKQITIPDFFLCPLTQKPMIDPVIAMDENTYERSELEKWFELHDYSPITGKPISTHTIPNHQLKLAYEQWKINNS
eukprot:c21540_g3_i1.p1 GENE.c21540_g3_i1~~c21540_g3_i1.p1  ORF type:complete len:545 (-),score=186.51 c21540_g3_i1:63-1697(-)